MHLMPLSCLAGIQVRSDKQTLWDPRNVLSLHHSNHKMCQGAVLAQGVPAVTRHAALQASLP